MNEMLTVDDLTFEVRRSARRKTLEITVDRGGELVLSAPAQLDQPSIDSFVREKREWIYRKLAEKAMYRKPRPPRQFVSGEGFLYLGRSYRLKLVDQQDCPLKLTNGRFCLKRSEVERGREHFIKWYTEHGRKWLARRLPSWANRMGVTPAGIRVLDLGHRWGSCSRAGNVNVHWSTIQLPASVVDYIIVHELAHLQEPTHGPLLWRLIERTMPEYQGQQRWLAEHGQVFAGI